MKNGQRKTETGEQTKANKRGDKENGQRRMDKGEQTKILISNIGCH